MRRRVFLLLLSCLLAATAVAITLTIPARTRARQESQLAPDANRVILYFAAKQPPLPTTLLALPEEPRRAAIVDSLRATAATDQQRVLHDLETLRATGVISSYRSLWIVNAIAVAGSSSVLHELARHPDVVRAVPDEGHAYFGNAIQSSISTTATGSLPDSGLHQIRARHVWEGLGVDGSGVTVAIVDTGVDWQHPDLQRNYRGNLGGGRVDHSTSWFHTSIPTATTPFDPHGHGTHVTGTAVGQNGIGVAPGAHWIAVAIADENGIAYDSDIHAAFQWLLAPGGIPARAPDIVSNSWGGAPERTVFQPDVDILHAAGIITIFAAGNTGPGAGTINSPAGFAGTIAVGAVDERDEITWFSSRGPSPHTADPKPLVTAPGTNILSALSGGDYGRLSGTSMATPHVAGTVALLLSANQRLDRTAVIAQLASTAVATNPPHPNNTSGHGLIDAFAAVAPFVRSGRLQVSVSDAGRPLPLTPVVVVTKSGAELPFTTDAAGRLDIPLKPGRYVLRIALFGYEHYNSRKLDLRAGKATAVLAALHALPTGHATGRVVDANGEPLAATLSVLGTSIEVATDNHGRFALTLPAGTYQLQARAIGHVVATEPLQMQAGHETAVLLTLPAGPRILLVDSGRYRFSSGYTQYAQALTDAGLAFDTFPVTSPEVKPSLELFQTYDVVVWSAPDDSPGMIGANDIITDYLGLGGRMLLSGQNLGNLDGRNETLQPWWNRQLRAQFVGETAANGTLQGAPGTPFDGLTFTLNGASGAANQRTPDVAIPAANTLTTPVVQYPDGRPAGLFAGACTDFRLVYFGFGLEGVTQPATRRTLVRRSLDMLLAPPNASGLQWRPAADAQFVLPGKTLTAAIELQHLGEVLTDTFSLQVNGRGWQTSVLTPTVTLGPCERTSALLSATVPPGTPPETSHTVDVTAVSQRNPAVRETFSLTLKTPGRLLLVDDDRFFDREAVYTDVLDELGLVYDVWETGWNGSGRGSPPLELLQAYETVIWFTGYDWNAPITPVENARLHAYVAGGGRLFLSSQDYAYWNGRSVFASQYLGLLSHQESVTPTLAWAPDSRGRPAAAAYPLSFSPYKNFGDGLVVRDGWEVALWHNGGLGGVRYPGDDGRVVFWSIPFEALPAPARPGAMRHTLGRLGDLGASTWEVDTRQGAAGAERGYTLTLRLAPDAPQRLISVTNRLPDALALLPQSLGGGATYDAATHTLLWQDVLSPGTAHVIHYRARTAATLPDSTAVVNSITAGYADQLVPLQLDATTWIGAPDLTESRLAATVLANGAVQTATYTLALVNSGLQAADPLTAALQLPDAMSLLTDSLRIGQTHGDFIVANDRLTITHTLPPGALLTATLRFTKTLSLQEWVPLLVSLDDGVSAPVLLYEVTNFPPYRMYLPAVALSPRAAE